jgi:hypothetical protein
MNPRHATALLSLFGLFLLSPPAWAWFAEGHEIVAVIAADNLTHRSVPRGARSRRASRYRFGGKGDGCCVNSARH